MTVRAHRWHQIGTNVDVVVNDGDPDRAAAAVQSTIAAADRAFSRFHEDSELSLVNRAGGRRVHISSLFAHALEASLGAAKAH